ncbi:hypothetical protein GMOD_00003483 [Pyrenophora seminiperda CCB06]|uniref:Uncharacterized protein n=1 Tax=Pyrenophora seminiperda CCB06 TaxID=1302712 RepID=A0A3M7MIW2_9PLEO|nr:hypothetical protein GMOD_00003483 [Pyrenophora seminiperda CCB06]
MTPPLLSIPGQRRQVQSIGLTNRPSCIAAPFVVWSSGIPRYETMVDMQWHGRWRIDTGNKARLQTGRDPNENKAYGRRVQSSTCTQSGLGFPVVTVCLQLALLFSLWHQLDVRISIEARLFSLVRVHVHYAKTALCELVTDQALWVI